MKIMKFLKKMKTMAHKLKSRNGKPRDLSEEGIKDLKEEIEGREEEGDSDAE